MNINQLLAKLGRQVFRAYTMLVNPKYEVAEIHRIFADMAQRIKTTLETPEAELYLIVAVPPRHGKEMASDTPILTTKGWTTHGELKEGDYVFSPSGKPVRVFTTIPQEQPADMLVTFTDGTTLQTHSNHEWNVHDTRKHGRPIVTLETKDIKEALLHQKTGERGSRYFFQLPNQEPLELPYNSTLPIDPYVLGVWLGDGTSDSGRIIFAKDEENDIHPHIEKHYVSTSRNVHKRQESLHRHYRGLVTDLKKANLYKNKHIPEIYYTSSEEQRLSLIQGLIDTDGSIGKDGRIRFVNTNIKLINGLNTLIRSFGIRTSITQQEPKMSTSGVEGKQTVYTIAFSPHTNHKFARVKHKLNNQKVCKRRKISISSIEETTPKKGECISIESADGLYLAGHNLIPTHNTHTFAELMGTWLMGLLPGLELIFATHTGKFAEKVGYDMRGIISSKQYKAMFPDAGLRKDAKARGDFKLENGSIFKGVGEGGNITGYGANIIIADDMIKSRQDAESKIVRDRVWTYFRDTLGSRLQPYKVKDGESKETVQMGKVKMVIMQRWHEDDPVGRLLEEQQKRENEDPNGEFERWEVINFEAIASEDQYYKGKLFRKEGEPLWKEVFDLGALAVIKAKSLYAWASQYQQDPILSELQIFNQNMFKYYDPSDLEDSFNTPGRKYDYYTFVDPAISQDDDADNAVIVTIAKDRKGHDIYRMREDAGHYTPRQLIDIIFLHYEEFGSKVTMETIAFQQMLKFALQEEQEKRGVFFKIHETKRGNKEMRIGVGLLSLYERGVVYHRKGGRDSNYELELIQFPRGKRDDRADAMSFLLDALKKTEASRVSLQVRSKFKSYINRKR